MSGAVGARRDPGAQPERTRLAWRRTTLSFALVVVLAVRGLAVAGDGRGPAVAATAGAALLWVGFLALAHHRMRALTDPRPGAPGGGTVAGAAALVLALAVAILLSAGG